MEVRIIVVSSSFSNDIILDFSIIGQHDILGGKNVKVTGIRRSNAIILIKLMGRVPGNVKCEVMHRQSLKVLVRGI